MEDITDADYVHATFRNKKLRRYYDWYVQSDTLLLAGVFETLTNICVKICKLDPAKFL